MLLELFSLYPLFLAATVAWILSRQGVDKASIAIVLAGLALYEFQFYSTRPSQFAYDIRAHMDYIMDMVRSGAIPSPDAGPAHRHPPLYYGVAAMLKSMAESLGAHRQWMAVRQLSMTCFMGFIIFSVLTLRRIQLSPVPYYTALLLLVFWPIGMTMGARINCDILLYAGVAGMLYYTLRWQEQFAPRMLALAILCGGVSVLAKNFGVAYCAGLALFVAAQRQPWRSLLRRDILLASAFTALCILITCGRGWIAHYVPSHYPVHHVSNAAWEYLRFDLPFYISDSVYRPYADQGHLFWHMFFRTLALGEFPWKSDPFVLTIGVGVLPLVAYALLSALWIMARSPGKRRVFTLFFATIILMVASMVALRLAAGHPAYGDARYIHPIVLIIAAFYGMALEWYWRQRHFILYGAGLAVAFLFTFCSIGLIISEHFL